MQYREIRPRGAAQEFVDAYWYLEGDGGAAEAVQRVVPDGRPELILNAGEPFESWRDGEWQRQPQAFVSGQITGPLLLRSSGRARILGVRFLPQGAARVLGLPMGELTGRAVAIDEVHPALARALEEGRDTGSFGRIEDALVRASGPEDGLASEAVRQLVQSRGGCAIGGLAERLGISRRQFERRFERSVGMTPKLFSRIQRFQEVFQVIAEGRPNWVEAAVACGYYDQAHLIRDFLEFSGETPAVLVAGTELARHFIRATAASGFYAAGA